MGTSLLKGVSITNRDATPSVATNSRIKGAQLRSVFDFVTAAASDDTSSIYRLCPVPSNAIVRRVTLSSVAQGGSAAVDVGVYRSTVDGGAVVDVNLFGSAVSVVSVVPHLDVTNESTEYTAANRHKPLWEAAGLSADPGGELDICVSVQAALSTGGAIGLLVEYVI